MYFISFHLFHQTFGFIPLSLLQLERDVGAKANNDCQKPGKQFVFAPASGSSPFVAILKPHPQKVPQRQSTFGSVLFRSYTFEGGTGFTQFTIIRSMQ